MIKTIAVIDTSVYKTILWKIMNEHENLENWVQLKYASCLCHLTINFAFTNIEVMNLMKLELKIRQLGSKKPTASFNRFTIVWL